MTTVTVILYGIGALAILISLFCMPKDEGDWFAIFLIGLVFAAIGFGIHWVRDFADAEPIHVLIVDTGLLVVAALIFSWRLIKSSIETRREIKQQETLEQQARNEQKFIEQDACDEQERLEQRARDEQVRLEKATRENEARRSALWARYGDDEIVEKIFDAEIWIGMTKDQLLDSKGSPNDFSTKESMRSKTEVWKYDQIRVNAYALKITLKDGIVEKIIDNR